MLSRNIGKAAALTAYHAYVHCRLRYGILFWGGSADISRVLILQKACLRRIFGMGQMDSCRPVFRGWGILTVIGTYIYESVLFFKFNENLFSDTHRGHDHLTRGRYNHLVPRYSYSYLQRNVHFMIVKIINKVPNHIKNNNIAKLRRLLKQFLVSKAYYTMEEFFSDTDI